MPFAPAGSAGTRPLALVASGRPSELEEEVSGAVQAALAAHPDGDVLVFLPGEREIRGVQVRLRTPPPPTSRQFAVPATASLRRTRGLTPRHALCPRLCGCWRSRSRKYQRRLESASLPGESATSIRVRPLYGALPFEKQLAAIRPPTAGERRVILSTTIAESSLTISGVRVVVDSGLRRCSSYDANTGMSALVTRPISKSSAEQRAGRAGRVAAGTAIRLWTEADGQRLAEQSAAEIEETDLASTALQLARWGAISDQQVSDLPWLTPPPPHSMRRARHMLVQLGALRKSSHGAAGEVRIVSAGSDEADAEESDSFGEACDDSELRLTRRGIALAALPAHPRLAHALLTAAAYEQGSAADRGETGTRPMDVACALASLVEEREVLQGGGRAHGADGRLRIRAILSVSPPADVATSRWQRARKTYDDLRDRARRLVERAPEARGKPGLGLEGGEGGDLTSPEDAAGEEAAAFRAEVAAARGLGANEGAASASVVPDSFSSADLAAALRAKQQAKSSRRAASTEPGSSTGSGGSERDVGASGGAASDDRAMAVAAEIAAAAFFDRVGQRQAGKDNVFLLANGRQASFASNTERLLSAADASYVVALALDGAEKRSARIQMALPITLEQLRRAVPQHIISSDESYFVPSDGSVRARRVVRLGSIEISSLPLSAPLAGSEVTIGLLLTAMRERGLKRALFGGDGGQTHPALELIARVRLMRALDPSAGWPLWSEEALLTDAENGWLALPLQQATSLKQLAAADTAGMLLATLPYEMQARLDECVPRSLVAPSGSTFQLSYVHDDENPLRREEDEARDRVAGADDVEDGTPPPLPAAPRGPVLAAKLQEWFGTCHTPEIGPPGGQLAVVLHLLSPAGRPLAITSDLPSFFAGPYKHVRAEMREKYKKHPWPEDPATAEPTRLTNRAIRQQQQGGTSQLQARGDGGGTGKGGKKSKGRGSKGGGGGKFPLKRSNFKRR